MNDHWYLEFARIFGSPTTRSEVQLASNGLPIRGDLKYGFAKPTLMASINLHAFNLVFEHPIKKINYTTCQQYREEFLGAIPRFLKLSKPRFSNLDNTFSG